MTYLPRKINNNNNMQTIDSSISEEIKKASSLLPTFFPSVELYLIIVDINKIASFY